MTVAHGPVVLFGGTFDPIHRAHINGARAIARALRCPVHLLPNAVPPHRDQPQADGEHRLAMLRLAVARYPELIADDWELRQDGPSWSLRTLQHFRSLAGERPLVLVIGADSLATLHTWRQWQDYPALCHLAVLPRPGARRARAGVLATFPEGDAGTLCQTPAGRRLMLKRPFLDVSATAVREVLARRGHCPALPADVEAYIHRHHLYNVVQRTDSTADTSSTDPGTA